MIKILALVLVSALIFAGCGGPNPLETNSGSGFFAGIWDGLTAWFALIGGALGGDYTIYEVKNTGGWYDFGFLIGVSMLTGGGGAGAGRARR